jgi:lipoprotein-releasing system ATP-binding protein
MNDMTVTDRTAMAPARQSGPEDPPILFLHAIDRHYRQGDVTLDILKRAELAIWPGQSVALVAPSGAGKSTLLHIAGLLEHPDGGEVYVDQVATSRLSDAERTRIRRVDMGFVYQFHHLLMEFSAIENVMMPQMVRGLSRREAVDRAADLLNYLGLKERLTHRPAELSGGEQQRVAIARALVIKPAIILADEPTGNLDTTTSGEIMALFQGLNRQGITIIMVTHEPDIAAFAGRQLVFRDGLIVDDRTTETGNREPETGRA